MIQKVHIIDGNNFFTKHYFTGMDNMSECVSRLSQFCNRYKGRIMWAFDTTKSQRRLSLYPEYKAGRKTSLTPEQYEQFKNLMGEFRCLIKAMGYTEFDGKGYEADDYISVVSKMLKSYKVYIHSTDHDFLQLVSDNVSIVWNKNDGEHIIIPDNFVEEVGVGMEYFMDYKCMIGDKSDNIPGIDGVGEVTAKKYIDLYGHYKDIVEALKPKLAETKKAKQPTKTELKILNGVETMRIARELVDLSINYKDLVLRDLVKKCVKESVCDKEKILEILTNGDAETSFDIIKALCKNQKTRQ